MSSDLDRHVDHVRAFNRFYTRQIGVLPESYLDSAFSLAETRVLYELAHRQRTTASELTRELDLDPGYLSRILRSFLDRGLVDRQTAEHDARQSWLQLTPAGQAAFEPLDRGAREQIGSLLRRLEPTRQAELVGAMRTIQRLLAEPDAAAREPYVIRNHRPGDMGWVVHRHGVLYAREYGFDETFEALVASIVSRFIDRFDARRERCWIAERDGQVLGSVFLVKAGPTTAQLRLFLVEPEARGLGIGSKLIDELLQFARAVGYRRIRLWTQNILLAARHIYARAGFRIIHSEPHHHYGQQLVAETWELRL